MTEEAALYHPPGTKKSEILNFFLKNFLKSPLLNGMGPPQTSVRILLSALFSFGSRGIRDGF